MTRRARGPVPTAVAAVVVAGALSSCATTYDTSATTVASAPATTAYVATGSTAELLAAISTEVARLSERLVDNDGQRDALARIDAQWAVVRPTVATDRPELLDGFDAAIAQVRRSVERRRPADADKAAKNLTALIAAYDA